MHTTTQPIEELVWELRRAFRDLGVAADRLLAPLGITVGDRALLEFLTREAEPVTISNLARKRSVSRQHIHQSLKRLPDPAWVECLPDPEDRRNVRLRLSAKGRAFWRRLRSRDEAFFARLAPKLPRAEVTAATRLLRDLRKAVLVEEGGLHV